MKLEIRHDAARGRFFAVIGGKEAYLSYRPVGGKKLDYMSTFVPADQRGRKIGERLVQHALGYAREKGYEVIPTCLLRRTGQCRYCTKRLP